MKNWFGKLIGQNHPNISDNVEDSVHTNKYVMPSLLYTQVPHLHHGTKSAHPARAPGPRPGPRRPSPVGKVPTQENLLKNLIIIQINIFVSGRAV